MTTTNENYCYFLDVLLQFEKFNKSRQTSAEYVLNKIQYGLKTVFGEVGAAFPVEIVQFSPSTSNNSIGRSTAENEANVIRLILSCPAHCAVKLRASLTLHGSYQGERCAYHVLRAADNLLSLCEGKENNIA